VHFLKSITIQLGSLLARYGGWGLLAINFFDSSFLSFPVINDLLLLHLAAQYPHLALAYALQATSGSVLGAYTLYAVSRWGGRLLGRRTPPQSALSRTRVWLERNDFVTVLVFCLLPPPAPFKLISIAAGALRVNPVRFVAALLLGRCARFMAEGWIGAQYGAGAEAFLRRNIGWASWSAAAVIIAGTLAYRLLARRNPRIEAGDQGKA